MQYFLLILLAQCCHSYCEQLPHPCTESKLEAYPNSDYDTNFVTHTAEIAHTLLFPNELSYQESIEAIALNKVFTQDGSRGTVWFNTTNFCLPDLHFREIGYHAVVSQESCNYLTLITKLADAALKQGLHGDYVFLLFKFLHEGRELPTGIRRFSPMVFDMARSLDSISSFLGERLSLLKYLKKTSGNYIIQDLYDIVAKERKTKFLRFYRSVARKAGRLILDYKDDSLYYLFVRVLGVPVRSSCQVHSVYDENFKSLDVVLSKEIERCHGSTELDFYSQSCSIRLILPRVSELRTGKC